MKTILWCLLFLTAFSATGRAADTVPEYFGVYARYKSGELVQIKGMSPSLTQILVLPTTTDAAMHAPKFHYLMSEPAVTLDVGRVEAFILYGDAKVENNTAIYYFGKADKKNISFFENRGSGGKNNSWLNTDYSCGPHDGMQYKKIKDGMYLFAFPVNETTPYKYCDLKIGKTANTKLLAGDVTIDFFGWWYGGQFWPFKTK